MQQDLTMMIGKRPARMFRMRIWLLAEMVLFAFLIGLALIGGMINSGMHRMLADLHQVLGWSMTAAAVGAAGLGFALVEWFWGEHWDDRRIKWVCQARMWSAAIAIICWAVPAVTIYAEADLTLVQFPLVFGPIAIFFHLASGIAVRQVVVLLDPSKDTRTLEARLERNRLAL